LKTELIQDTDLSSETKLIKEEANKMLHAVVELVEAMEAVLPGTVLQQVGEPQKDQSEKITNDNEEEDEEEDEKEKKEEEENSDSGNSSDNEMNETTGKKKSHKKSDNSGLGRCSFHYAVLAEAKKSEECKYEKSSTEDLKLLAGLVHAAKRSKKLADALVIRDDKGYTPLLIALQNDKINSAICIIRASRDEGCVHAVQAAYITNDGTEKG
jgi:hypothetical protein